MKEKLKKKLDTDRRNFTWFWETYIRDTVENCSYAFFMATLNGRYAERQDIVDIVERYLLSDEP